jgi:hypothetical protein
VNVSPSTKLLRQQVFQLKLCKGTARRPPCDRGRRVRGRPVSGEENVLNLDLTRELLAVNELDGALDFVARKSPDF